VHQQAVTSSVQPSRTAEIGFLNERWRWRRLHCVFRHKRAAETGLVQAFQLLNHPLDDAEAALPERRIAGIETERG